MDIAVKALSLVAVIVIGNLIKRLGWVSTQDFGAFAKIVLRITLPCALITSFNDYDMPVSLLGLALAGILVNLVLQVAGFLLEARHGRRSQAFAVLNLPSFNMGAFATPYLAGFMGPATVVHASLFDAGNAIAAAGYGYAWSTGRADESRRTTTTSFLRTMSSSVIFDVYLVLIGMQLMDLRFPAAVITFTSTVGAAITFLVMLMIGIGMEIRLERSQYRQAARYLAVRYLLCAAMATVVWQLPIPDEHRLLLVIVLFAPIAAMSPGFTAEIGSDVQQSTLMTSISILVGIVAMPLFVLLLG